MNGFPLMHNHHHQKKIICTRGLMHFDMRALYYSCYFIWVGTPACEMYKFHVYLWWSEESRATNISQTEEHWSESFVHCAILLNTVRATRLSSLSVHMLESSMYRFLFTTRDMMIILTINVGKVGIPKVYLQENRP